MGKRIRLGQLSGTTYGLKISKEGQDVDSATGKNLLFDSTNPGKSPIYFGKTVNVGNSTINNNIGKDATNISLDVCFTNFFNSSIFFLENNSENFGAAILFIEKRIILEIIETLTTTL